MAPQTLKARRTAILEKARDSRRVRNRKIADDVTSLVIDLVSANPQGISIKDLAANAIAAGIPISSTTHVVNAIDRLKDANLIQTYIEPVFPKGAVTVYPMGVEITPPVHVRKNGRVRDEDVLAALRDAPDSTMMELSAATGRSETAVQRVVTRLLKYGVITQTNPGHRPHRFAVTDAPALPKRKVEVTVQPEPPSQLELAVEERTAAPEPEPQPLLGVVAPQPEPLVNESTSVLELLYNELTAIQRLKDENRNLRAELEGTDAQHRELLDRCREKVDRIAELRAVIDGMKSTEALLRGQVTDLQEKLQKMNKIRELLG